MKSLITICLVCVVLFMVSGCNEQTKKAAIQLNLPSDFIFDANTVTDANMIPDRKSLASGYNNPFVFNGTPTASQLNHNQQTLGDSEIYQVDLGKEKITARVYFRKKVGYRLEIYYKAGTWICQYGNNPNNVLVYVPLKYKHRNESILVHENEAMKNAKEIYKKVALLILEQQSASFEKLRPAMRIPLIKAGLLNEPNLPSEKCAK